jgi:hypothetical protein
VAHLPDNEHNSRNATQRIWPSGVSSAAKLHQIELRACKNHAPCDLRDEATPKRKSPAKAGLLFDE